MAGNPTIPSGAFYDAFNSKLGLWNCITMDAFDTPDLNGLTLEAPATNRVGYDCNYIFLKFQIVRPYLFAYRGAPIQPDTRVVGMRLD